MLDDIGIRIAVSRIFNWFNNIKLYNKPTSDMLQSQKYFKEHTQEINKIVSILSDEKSKDTYQRMIEFRGTFNNKILPDNHYRIQYFDNNFFSYAENETLIDCGAYDGDTIRAFCQTMKKKKIKKYNCIAFEPDKENYLLLSQNYPEFLAINTGVWKENQIRSFITTGNSTSNFQELSTNNSNVNVPVKCLDGLEECRKATLIKMDIEGDEYEALLGAKSIITTNKPKLAICIYHSDQDMIRIPLLLHELVPEYKLFVMQHSNTLMETVLYATI